ncbi:hypothetical protein DFQ15_10189 [Xylophilus ampelinus]|uniref:Uncharacterized protein n=1 Tax=Xylophilus ampelinus TaxID=54067 RepID=A0A318SQS7_9BURK|nr:hypothetical protein DFQ15_10189 [Xylophilus ampelinus]
MIPSIPTRVLLGTPVSTGSLRRGRTAASG